MKLYPSNDKLCEWMDGWIGVGPITSAHTDTPSDTPSDAPSDTPSDTPTQRRFDTPTLRHTSTPVSLNTFDTYRHLDTGV